MFSFNFKVLILSIVLCGGILGQPNSVELKDANGNLINTYPSITAAYNAIPAVVAQKYLIEILPAYNTVSELFPIQIYAKSGTSSENTITLRPAAGNSALTISRALNNNPIFNLNGVKYFILDGRPGGMGDSADMVIENTLNNGAKTNTINFIDGASYNIVKYVIAKSVPRSNAGPRNIYFSSSNSGNTTNNLIENCKIAGGRAGISFSGISSGLNSGNTIRNCEIYNFGLVGIWMISAAENTTIQDCEIYQGESGLNTSMVGGIILSSSAARGVNEISNNKIFGLKHNSYLDSAAVWGILAAGADGSTLNIYNNFIALPDDNQNTNSTHGIFLNEATQFTANIFHNTVRVGGVQSGSITEGQILSSAITQGNTNTGSEFNVVNNIFINSRTGGTGYHVAAHYQYIDGNLNIDYNCYYSESTMPAFHTVWGSALFNFLPDYTSAAYPNEQNSIFKDVSFFSATDLHLTGMSIGDMDLAALPSGLSFDIDYDIRDAVYPYKGADEAEALPVELSSFSASVSGNNVTLTWTTKTESNNAGFEIERKDITGWITISHITGNGTSTIENNYTYTEVNLLPGTYTYRLKQIDFGGSYTYYNLQESIEILNPVQYNLSQNYPNPFNPSTVIEYTMPQDGNVNLTIYTITGEKAAVIVNSVQKAGSHKVDFNASSLASGTYIYRLEAGGFISTKKMTLLR